MTPDEAVATAKRWTIHHAEDEEPFLDEVLVAEINRLRARVRELELIYKIIPRLEATSCSCRVFRSYVPGEIRDPCSRCVKLYEAKQELTKLQKGLKP